MIKTSERRQPVTGQQLLDDHAATAPPGHSSNMYLGSRVGST
jgi:hypothetical protein